MILVNFTTLHTISNLNLIGLLRECIITVLVAITHVIGNYFF